MEITIGKEYVWTPWYRYLSSERVTVVAQRRGGFKLSNGWVVDEGGFAYGTDSHRGGQLSEMTQ